MAKQEIYNSMLVFIFRNLLLKGKKNKANESLNNEWHIVYYIKLDNI